MRGYERLNPFGRGAEARVVTHESVLPAAPAEVFDLVADVTRIAEWWPRATGGEVIEGQDVGRRQRVLVDWGRQTGMVEQAVTQWDRPRTYAWRIVKETSTKKGVLPPLADVSIVVEIRPQGGASLVRITGEYRPAGVARIPAIRQLARHAKITYRHALSGLEDALIKGR